MTPECTQAIKEYLQLRRDKGETIVGTSPLIREQFNPQDKKAANPERLTLPGVSKSIMRVLLKAGINTNGEVMRNIGFRKFAITMMKKAGVDFGDREYLVGHKHSRGLDVNYDRTSEEDRLLEWSKGIDNLTINQAYRLKKKLQKVEGEYSKKLAILEEEIARNRKATEHALAMAEAAKGAVATRSEAANLPRQ